MCSEYSSGYRFQLVRRPARASMPCRQLVRSVSCFVPPHYRVGPATDMISFELIIPYMSLTQPWYRSVALSMLQSYQYVYPSERTDIRNDRSLSNNSLFAFLFLAELCVIGLSFNRLSPSVSVSLETYECTLRLWLAIGKFVSVWVIQTVSIYRRTPTTSYGYRRLAPS